LRHAARAAAIVMRVVRNIVDTGRTLVCTIHQPSIDIFEAFDDLVRIGAALVGMTKRLAV
jgi:archaellum biogenesis ATPase FlaH